MPATATDLADPAVIAGDLRVVLGQLVRRLRATHRLPLPQAIALGRLERDGPQSVSDLAAAERLRPQSMAQTVNELEADGLVTRWPDPGDRRRALVDLTAEGREMILADRRQREGWLATAIARDLSDDEQASLERAVALLRRLADA